MKILILLSTLLIMLNPVYSQEYSRLSGRLVTKGCVVSSSKSNSRSLTDSIKTCEVILDEFIDGSNRGTLNKLGCDEVVFILNYEDQDAFLKEAEVCKREPWPWDKWMQYKNIVDEADNDFTNKGKKVSFIVKDSKSKKLLHKSKKDLKF